MPKGRAERCPEPFPGSFCSGGPIHTKLRNGRAEHRYNPPSQHFHRFSNSNYAERDGKLRTTIAPPPCGVISSTHEFQMLRNHANCETPPLVQLAAETRLPRGALMALLLNLSMILPLAQSLRCMNHTTANRHTSNHEPSTLPSKQLWHRDDSALPT